MSSYLARQAKMKKGNQLSEEEIRRKPKITPEDVLSLNNATEGLGKKIVDNTMLCSKYMVGVAKQLL